ncbi:C2 domain-containing protein [Lactarius indigo]|nr:C2 domain-containing protein [Lactarius indigo]
MDDPTTPTSNHPGSNRFSTPPMAPSSEHMQHTPYPGEAPVILRVQILSCHDLEAKDSNGLSDPYVVVSGLGRQFQTPVCERNLNPDYEPKDATFDFPVYKPLVHKLGTLKFVVWDKDKICDDYLGECALPVDRWFEKPPFDFNDPKNQPFSVDLISSRRTKVHGTMSIKSGFVQPPDFKSLLDFGQIYEALITKDDHVGIVVLEISGAKDLPKWPNMIHIGWDMDPFVQVSIENKVAGATPVIKHSLNPVWNEQLFIHDKFTFDDRVGEAEIDIASLVEKAPKKDPKTGRYPDYLPAMPESNLPLKTNPKRTYKITPTITFRANYRPYGTLGQQKGH